MRACLQGLHVSGGLHVSVQTLVVASVSSTCMLACKTAYFYAVGWHFLLSQVVMRQAGVATIMLHPTAMYGCAGVVYSGVWQGTPVAVKFIIAESLDELTKPAREAVLSRVVG
jgi:hypothetical protein